MQPARRVMSGVFQLPAFAHASFRGLRGTPPCDGGPPFSADPGNATVTHHVDVALFPNWQGQDQVRRVTIDGRRLSIIASDRTAADGRTFHSELTWLKV